MNVLADMKNTNRRNLVIGALAALAMLTPQAGHGQVTSHISLSYLIVPGSDYNAVPFYRSNARGAEVSVFYDLASRGRTPEVTFAIGAGIGANFFDFESAIYFGDPKIMEGRAIQYVAGAGPAIFFRRKIYEAHLVFLPGLRYITVGVAECDPTPACSAFDGESHLSMRFTAGFAVYLSPYLAIQAGAGTDKSDNAQFTLGLAIR